MANSYFDNKKKSMCSICSYCIIMTITGRSICSVSSYCDNNGDVYM
jgi:hypothetical protein